MTTDKVRLFPNATVSEVYQLTIEANVSLEDRIVQGNYNEVDGNITQVNFPKAVVIKAYEGEFVLLHLAADASTEEVLAEITNRNLVPATLSELLALGQHHPDVQRGILITTVNEDAYWFSQEGEVGMSWLSGWDGNRRLEFSWASDKWKGDCHFLCRQNTP